MTSTHTAPAAKRRTESLKHRIGRIILIAAVGILSAQSAGAQNAPERTGRWEFLVSSGGVLPTGAQRDAIKRGNLTTAQLWYFVRRTIGLTATVGWARSRDIASAGDPKLDVFTYDIGAEVRAPRPSAARRLTIRPFAGAGVGARSYNYRSLDVDATHNVAAYGSAGAEFGMGRVRLRLEVRDYVSGFKALDGQGSSGTRNDVVVVAGLRFTKRSA